MIAEQSNPPPPKRRWYQYSLRTLLIFMTVAACGFGWLGVKVRQARRQKEAVDRFEALGGGVIYDYEIDVEFRWIADAKPPGPIWLHRVLGDDFFRTAVAANFYPDMKDIGVENLKELPQLKYLSLISHIPNTEIEELKHAFPNCKIYR